MPLRPAKCFRNLERPYTRISYKVKNKNFIPGAPETKIREFEMGNKNLLNNYEIKVMLIAKNNLQIRDNAIEAARVMINKYLEKNVGKENYFFIIKKYPHHVLREHPIATGAGADRYSQGMRLAFGRPIGRAIRVLKDDIIFEIFTYKRFLEHAKEAMKRGKSKLPLEYKIAVEENTKN